MADLAIRKLPEGNRDPDLGFAAGNGLEHPPVEIGKEEWRDGPTDDGEPTEDEALSINFEDDPEVQNDVA